MISKYSKEIKEYLKNSILKPYLIHVEFEVMNILTQIKLDLDFRNLYNLNGLNIKILENKINDFINSIQKIIKLLDF